MQQETQAQPSTLSLFTGEFAATTRIEKIQETRNKNFKARNERIRVRFNELHNDRRIRFDDVIETLALDFCLAKSTIMRALKGD